ALLAISSSSCLISTVAVDAADMDGAGAAETLIDSTKSSNVFHLDLLVQRSDAESMPWFSGFGGQEREEVAVMADAVAVATIGHPIHRMLLHLRQEGVGLEEAMSWAERGGKSADSSSSYRQGYQIVDNFLVRALGGKSAWDLPPGDVGKAELQAARVALGKFEVLLRAGCLAVDLPLLQPYLATPAPASELDAAARWTMDFLESGEAHFLELGSEGGKLLRGNRWDLQLWDFARDLVESRSTSVESYLCDSSTAARRQRMPGEGRRAVVYNSPSFHITGVAMFSCVLMSLGFDVTAVIKEPGAGFQHLLPCPNRVVTLDDHYLADTPGEILNEETAAALSLPTTLTAEQEERRRRQQVFYEENQRLKKQEEEEEEELRRQQEQQQLEQQKEQEQDQEQDSEQEQDGGGVVDGDPDGMDSMDLGGRRWEGGRKKWRTGRRRRRRRGWEEVQQQGPEEGCGGGGGGGGRGGGGGGGGGGEVSRALMLGQREDQLAEHVGATSSSRRETQAKADAKAETRTRPGRGLRLGQTSGEKKGVSRMTAVADEEEKEEEEEEEAEEEEAEKTITAAAKREDGGDEAEANGGQRRRTEEGEGEGGEGGEERPDEDKQDHDGTGRAGPFDLSVLCTAVNDANHLMKATYPVDPRIADALLWDVDVSIWNIHSVEAAFRSDHRVPPSVDNFVRGVPSTEERGGGGRAPPQTFLTLYGEHVEQ
ncbi:unnamed protein product, partial [Hapterophycus canaliculatus]